MHRTNPPAPTPATTASAGGTAAGDYLSLKAPAFPAGDTVYAGPVALSLGTFWDQESPHVWVKVQAPLVAGIRDGVGNLLEIPVRRVETGAGNAHDATSTFETPFFQKVRLNYQDYPQPMLAAIRDVHLKAGTREQDIRSVEGRVVLHAPQGVDTFDVPAKAGETTSAQGVTARVEEVDVNQVRVILTGKVDNLVTLLGVDGAGNKVKQNSASWSSSPGSVRYTLDFKGHPDIIRCHVAHRVVTREFPFRLTR